MEHAFHHRELDTPLGTLAIMADRQGTLLQIAFAAAPARRAWAQWAAVQGASLVHDSPFCDPVVAQLEEYFRGERREFTVSVRPRGSDFQRQVWHALTHIPYGQTVSYGALADRLGSGTSARAVGRANATNPIPIVIPCHRVIGADGTLVGYGGGLDRKRWLLALEGALPALEGKPGGRRDQLDLGLSADPSADPRIR